MPENRAVIQPDTVDFLLHSSKMPFWSSTENATMAVTKLIHALRNLAPAAPYAHICDAQMQALDQLAENFQHATVQPQQQVPTEATKQPPVSPPRVAPKFPRVNIPPITETTDQENFTPPLPNQSENRVHIIPPDTPTPPMVEKRTRQQETPKALPLKPKIPPSSAPSTHQYPFRHPRQRQPAVTKTRYANDAKHIYNLEVNAVLNLLTDVLQEFRHLIKVPDKEIRTKYLANKFGRLAQ